MQRFKLTVEVCDADRIVIDERQLAHAGARQRLNGVAADAAETENGNMAVLEKKHGFLAKDHLCA